MATPTAATPMPPEEKARKVLLWLAFSVVFALGPLLVNFLLVRHQTGFELTRVYDRGELFLISTALCGDAVGRLFNHKGSASIFVLIPFQPSPMFHVKH
jgi:hypothetical protein